MNRLNALACIVAVIFGMGNLAQAQDKPAPKPAAKDVAPPAKPAPKADAKTDAKPAAKPEAKTEAKADEAGPNHKWLGGMEGEWQAVVKEFDPSGTGTDAGTGTMTSKMQMGGRFLVQDYDGRSHGKFFRGHGIIGYNNAAKKFEMVWSDSQSTALTIMTGTADAAGKVLTLTGEMTDPATGKKSSMKTVLTVTSDDSQKEETFVVQGGKDVKVMEIVSTKGKAAKKPDAPSAKEEKKEEKKDEKKGK